MNNETRKVLFEKNSGINEFVMMLKIFYHPILKSINIDVTEEFINDYEIMFKKLKSPENIFNNVSLDFASTHIQTKF